MAEVKRLILTHPSLKPVHFLILLPTCRAVSRTLGSKKGQKIMMKRAVIYARVSSDDQSEKGYSLPSQADACQAFAEKAGFTRTITLLEDHSGATPIADRPQGARLVEMVKRREVDAVIVYQIDRLSRDIVNLLATIQTWLKAGIAVFSLDIGQIESELDVVLIVKGWQGSDERAKIRERSMRGKWAKAQAGKVVGVRAPYGYQHVRDSHGKVETLEPVDETAQIVKLIYQWYVYGDEKGIPLSTGTITRRLSEMGIPTPGELKEYKNRRREDCIWTRDTVVSILSREAYAVPGILVYLILAKNGYLSMFQRLLTAKPGRVLKRKEAKT
jgi:site-specific DNA recombinase